MHVVKGEVVSVVPCVCMHVYARVCVVYENVCVCWCRAGVEDVMHIIVWCRAWGWVVSLGASA